MTACPTCRPPRRLTGEQRERWRPRRAAPVLCQPCADYLRADVARLPGLYERLTERLVGSGRGGPAVSVSRDPGINLNTGVLRLRDNITVVVESWAGIVADERQFSTPLPGVLACSSYLLTHHDYAMRQGWATEYCESVRELIGRAFALIVPPRARQFGGACDQTIDTGDRCPGNVLVDPDLRKARCSYCGTETDAGDWWARVFAAVDDDYLATASDTTWLLALRDGIVVSDDLIRQWAHRGRLVPRTHGARPLYRLGDVLELLDRARDTPPPKQA